MEIGRDCRSCGAGCVLRRVPQPWGTRRVVGVTGVHMSVSEWVTRAEIEGCAEGLGCRGRRGRGGI